MTLDAFTTLLDKQFHPLKTMMLKQNVGLPIAILPLGRNGLAVKTGSTALQNWFSLLLKKLFFVSAFFFQIRLKNLIGQGILYFPIFPQVLE